MKKSCYRIRSMDFFSNDFFFLFDYGRNRMSGGILKADWDEDDDSYKWY